MRDTKKIKINAWLIDLYHTINIDKPNNHDEILDYVYDDVEASADPFEYYEGDVAIGFRRWIESKSN